MAAELGVRAQERGAVRHEKAADAKGGGLGLAGAESHRKDERAEPQHHR